MKVKGRILYVNSDFILLSKGLTILKSFDNGMTWDLFTKLPSSILCRLVAKIHLVSRFFRLGVHHIIENVSVGYYIFYNKSLISIDLNGNLIGKPQPIKGSRPLAVINHKGEVYYGEYTSNPKREAVSIFAFNGFDHRVILNMDGIRHIHGLFKDPYSNKIYVSTGDYENEAGIWEFQEDSLKLLIGGTQQQRAVQLIFDENYIYYGTDTPLENNFIYRINKNSLKTDNMVRVSSSVFYGCRYSNNILFSTVVEPSEINKTKYIELWHYNTAWSCILKERKDLLPMKLFQYGQITFPTYSTSYNGNHLWFYKLGIVGSGTSEGLLTE